jgi:hypothetical protein
MRLMPQQGTEDRSSILPTAQFSAGDFGSTYSPASAMLTPPQLGVRVGDSMGDVVNAVKGVGFYVDQIGYGAPSTGLTNGMNLKPLGVNYFIKTGARCSNGADMWNYMEGIPNGDALGTKTKNVMAEMGLPPLKGLGPGMIEDAKHALDPAPLMNSLFGSGYPECKQVTLKVGDAYNRIKDPDTGDYWITNPDKAQLTDNGYVQTRWVQNTNEKGQPVNLTRKEWVDAKKTHNRNGTPKTVTSAFVGHMTHPSTIIVIGVLCLIAYGALRRR